MIADSKHGLSGDGLQKHGIFYWQSGSVFKSDRAGLEEDGIKYTGCEIRANNCGMAVIALPEIDGGIHGHGSCPGVSHRT